MRSAPLDRCRLAVTSSIEALGGRVGGPPPRVAAV